MANTSWLQNRRQSAWADGRECRDHLLHQYKQKYNLQESPPPALIVRELIRDMLGASLFFDPLPLDRYAEVRLVDGVMQVTVNSEIDQMDGVKDAEGVGNVAMWHEVIHIDRHAEVLVAPGSAQLPGFEEPAAIVCYRTPKKAARGDIEAREFWAEEAGRAAAVSFEALRRTDSFLELARLAKQGRATTSVWPLLYRSAEAIGVNSSALVKQLTLEGMIAVEGRGQGSRVVLQSPLLDLWS